MVQSQGHCPTTIRVRDVVLNAVLNQCFTTAVYEQTWETCLKCMRCVIIWPYDNSRINRHTSDLTSSSRLHLLFFIATLFFWRFFSSGSCSFYRGCGFDRGGLFFITAFFFRWFFGCSGGRGCCLSRGYFFFIWTWFFFWRWKRTWSKLKQGILCTNFKSGTKLTY